MPINDWAMVVRVSQPVVVAVRVLALLAVLVGGIGWVMTTRTVTLSVDGDARTLHSQARDVRGLLASNGIELGTHDVLTPAADTELAGVDEVILDRARPLTVTVDGKPRTEWVTARSVNEAIAELGLAERRLKVSASRSSRLPLDGFSMSIDTEKRVTLAADKKQLPVVTYLSTVGDLLTDQKLTLGEKDRVTPAADQALTDGATVTVARITSEVKVETQTVKAPEQKKTDASLMLDQKRVTDEGQDGSVEQRVEYVYADGVLEEKKVLSKRTVVDAKPRITVAGTKAYPPDDTGLNWAGLARCESTNNPAAVSSSGLYHGLYQFSVQTWESVGGIGLPSQATVREQTYRAIVLYKRSGRGQWPECGVNL